MQDRVVGLHKPFEQEKPRIFNPACPALWTGLKPRPYDWMVENCFLRGTVAMLSGDGGLGKSLLCQQLMTACALGRPWLGLQTKKCKTLALFCEDDLDELHRRQVSICDHYGVPIADLDDVWFESYAGKDATIISFPKWGAEGRTTALFDAIREQALDLGVELLFLDTLADVFSGNEIDRNQPRAFIRVLRRLAIEMQGCVVLTQHPSLAGMASGSGLSGSTGWNNSVRSRLYLTAPKSKDDDGPGNERVLKTMKNNQSSMGGKIKLEWRAGVFERIEESKPRNFYEPSLDDGWPG